MKAALIGTGIASRALDLREGAAPNFWALLNRARRRKLSTPISRHIGELS